jgi:hypothetical protein
MGKADFTVNNATRWTSPAFNIKTRVTPARKNNPFWNPKNSEPSPCVVISGRQQS